MNKGDRVWLLPDYDRREVKRETAAVVVKVVNGSGRVKVEYLEFGCRLSKTVDPKRVRPREEVCVALGEK